MTAHTTALALALTWALAATPALAQSDADVILSNAAVYTVSADEPWAEALAITGNRILAVGGRREVMMTRGPNTQVIDLQGAFVTPGFNDGHVHMDSTGRLLTGVNLLDVHDADALVERVVEATERLPEGSWILRGDWGAYEQWGQGSAGSRDQENADTDRDLEIAPTESQGPFTPHRDLIDPVTPEHPVLLRRFDGSMYLANSLALDLAGITAETADPMGGEIDKDADGRLTGILRGSAAALVEDVIPSMPFEQRLVGVRAVLDAARQGGVTTIQDLSSAEQVMAYQHLQRNGELTARIMIRPNIFQVEHVAGLGLSRGFGDDWLKLIGYKGWVDGIMGNSSAMFFEPYDHDPENRGRLRPPMLPEGEEGAAFSMDEDDHYSDFPPGTMESLIEAWLPTGVTPHIHAIGDLGNRIILDIFERVLKSHDMVDADHRWRVIHAQVVRDEDIPRFGELNLVAEVNPYHVSDDMRWMEERIGAERSQGAYAFRKLKDAGAVLVFGSDSPGTNAARYYLNPVYGLYAAVARQTLSGEPEGGWFPSQRLTIEEAIDAYTRAPAWASFEEDIKGTLEPGKLADITVFDTNLVEAAREDPARLLEAKVLYTIVDGQVVYRGGDD
ncbi:MAG: amidohydrolase [Gammaproteobacteria bacterium]|nr:amidohydrolase [Gammaproteobacteria bacterium]